MGNLSLIQKIIFFTALFLINSNSVVVAQYERDDIEVEKQSIESDEYKLTNEQQRDKMYLLFTKAVSTRDPADQYRLGKMFQHGAGVQKDDIQAYVWTALSLTNGYPGATKTLRDLEDDMSTFEIDYAIDMLKKIRELR